MASSYTVIARKWRPQTFDDVVGQDHVVQTLRNAIRSHRIAQAYLFVGPRGTGKTTLARIFAKALNCVNGPTETPCGICDACKEIAAGNSLDVMEIDGASNNKVEDVHAIRENIYYAPSRGKYRICYIDEVHMLSAAAFNALLKTLEEPPEHAKFIFATTEAEKILPTIISRCQRFDLRRISVPLIAERLKMIAKDEKIKISDDALLAVARGADGGMRDAQSALDQLIAFTGNKIDESDVLNVFGLVARSTLENLAGAILQGDIASVLKSVDELDKNGKDLRRLTFELIEHFRNLLVFIHVKNGAGIDLTDAQRATLEAQSTIAKPANVLHVTEILIELDNRLKTALSRRTLLETALVRAARGSTATPLEDILKQINVLKNEQGRATASSPSRTNEKRLGEDAVAPPTPSTPIVAEPPIDRNAILSKPSVKNALDILGGQITDIQ